MNYYSILWSEFMNKRRYNCGYLLTLPESI